MRLFSNYHVVAVNKKDIKHELTRRCYFFVPNDDVIKYLWSTESINTCWEFYVKKGFITVIDVADHLHM